MNHSKGTINIVQAWMILLLMNGLTDHVTVNPIMLDASGRDAWISILLTAIALIPWCGLLAFVIKRSGQEKLQPWLARQTTPVLGWVLVAPIGVLFYIIGGFTVIHTSIWTVTNYLPATPKFVLMTAIVLVCCYAAINGIRTIAICSGVLLPTVVLLGFFVAIFNTPQKDYGLLKPFLEHGWQPVFNGMIYAGGGFAELVVILMMQHHIKSPIKLWKLLLLAGMLVYISLGPLIGAITEFGPKEAAKQMISPYEQWRLVKLGEYIEHVDFLSVYQWLAGACVRISLALFLLADLLPFTRPDIRGRFIMIISVSFILLALLPINQNEFYMWMYKAYFPVTLAVIVLITVIWAIASLIKKSAREEST
ncbi:GerAB/ArcD/ProY family transporter [Paenibacillus piri]|uniref:Spore gernimation protein n=1 Tax=Paenibacillus piri TaxID=2547395 RepID=A0A4R5KXA0_9BACL|nr:endospore germination permease [Paenibacillus piri]TDG00457.1 spore gernimation protein [Paenibacillus piri]